MFPIPEQLTVGQWWWIVIAIGLAAMSAQYVGIARQEFWLRQESEKREEETMRTKYSDVRLALIAIVAMLGYAVSLLMVALVSPR